MFSSRHIIPIDLPAMFRSRDHEGGKRKEIPCNKRKQTRYNPRAIRGKGV